MALPFLTSHGIAIALNIGQAKLKKYIQKQIDIKILNKVEDNIEKEINLFVNNLKQKTVIYLCIATINISCLLISIYFSSYKFLNTIAFTVSLSFILYMAYNSISNFKKTIDYFQKFELHIKNLLENEFRNAKESNWKSKMALIIDSKEVHDYYLVVLDKIVSSTSAWLTKNKSLLYIRMGLFIFASICLTYSARELL